ncbi:MAG: IscA/HesB family protein [Desulfovibrionaceae bacterium]
MFSITKDALTELNAYFEGKDKQPIRVFLATGGCSGPRLAMSIDEATDAATDSIFEEDGYTFCVKTDLLSSIKAISIDSNEMGFTIESKEPIPSAGGGCGGCGGGCH